MLERQYARLTRLRRRRGRLFEAAGTYCSLWLGQDHLLSITSNRFAETYKRFYFRDIQAITILTTKRRTILNFAMAMLLFLGVVMWLSLPTGLAQWSPVFILISLFLLALNNALGPTCTVYVRTAVQVEELPSLSRIRYAHRVMNRIRPRIVAVQGELTPDEMASRLDQRFPSHRISLATGPLNLSS